MSIQSMTGYGSAEGHLQGWFLKVSARAVNHKALDVRVNCPREWAWFEPHIVKLVRGCMSRGRVDILVEARASFEQDVQGVGPLRIDERALGALVSQLKALGHAHGIEATVGWAELMPYRRLFEQAELQESGQDQDAEHFIPLVQEALDRFVTSRLQEGETIAQTMLGYLDFLAAGVARVEAIRPELLEGYRDRLKARLVEILEHDQIALDEQRLAQEVVIFADRTDVAEEIQRANAHIVRLQQLFKSTHTEPVGKKVDFYLQELIRETNTMASKSNFSDLTELVVQMKSVIEQMREQAANIE